MPPNTSTINPDEEDAKEILDLQNQISTILMRKRKRESDTSEDEVKHLKHRLTSSLERCQQANVRLSSALHRERQLRFQNELLEKETKKQLQSIKTFEAENQRLKVELENSKKRETALKKSASTLKERLVMVLEEFCQNGDS